MVGGSKRVARFPASTGSTQRWTDGQTLDDETRATSSHGSSGFHPGAMDRGGPQVRFVVTGGSAGVGLATVRASGEGGGEGGGGGR